MTKITVFVFLLSLCSFSFGVTFSPGNTFKLLVEPVKIKGYRYLIDEKLELITCMIPKAHETEPPLPEIKKGETFTVVGVHTERISKAGSTEPAKIYFENVLGDDSKLFADFWYEEMIERGKAGFYACANMISVSSACFARGVKFFDAYRVLGVNFRNSSGRVMELLCSKEVNIGEPFGYTFAAPDQASLDQLFQ